MFDCEMIQRHTGALSGMPFAAGYIALRSVDGPCTAWLRLDTIKKINEAFVYRHRHRWRRLPFMRLRPEHMEMVVIVNDEYVIHGIDIIKFLLECRLADER